MDTFLFIIKAVGRVFHWCTGWLVHPDRGGCCSDYDALDDVKKTYEELKKDK